MEENSFLLLVCFFSTGSYFGILGARPSAANGAPSAIYSRFSGRCGAVGGRRSNAATPTGRVDRGQSISGVDPGRYHQHPRGIGQKNDQFR